MLSDIGIPYHVQSRLAVLADGVFRAEIVCQHYIACARQLGHVRWRPASAVWCQARTRLLARAARLSARAQLRGSVATTMHVPLMIFAFGHTRTRPVRLDRSRPCSSRRPPTTTRGT